MQQFNKTTQHTAELLFVCKALATKASHKSENLQYLYSTGVDIVASDGHRLHVYTPEDCPLEAGYYEIIKKTKTELILNRSDQDLGDYPDYARVMPEAKDLQGFKLDSSISGKYATVIRAMDVNTLEYSLFLDAAPLMERYQVTDGTSPVLMTGKDVKAVVMPVRI